MSRLDVSVAPAVGDASECGAVQSRASKRQLLAGGLAACGLIGAFLVMAYDGRLRFGVPLGALGVAIGAWGLADLLASYVNDAGTRTVSLRALAPHVARAALAAIAHVLAYWGAIHGVVRQALAGALVTATFIGLVASVFALGQALGPWQTDENGNDRPLWRRHGFWLFVVSALLFLPALGNASLWDPWETHYAEVSREILARRDWISLWWTWQGWFFSKPVLTFWLQACAMATLGVHHEPGRMLEGACGAIAHPEWAVRAPIALFAMIGAYLLYKGVARHFGRRAGFFGGVVLATSPQWFFLAHQTMTDMPYVAAMSAAMGLVLLGLAEGDDARVRTYELRIGSLAVHLSAWHLVFGAILAVSAAQIAYLVSRNVDLVLAAPGPHGFRLHLDAFRAGSPGNCDLPGNPPCVAGAPASHFEPWAQALVWAVVLAALLALNWRERRVKRVLYLGAWLFAGLATMAKGPAGAALPALAVVAYMCATKRFAELARLEIVSGALIVLGLALPWFVAMVVRHGSAFTDELIFHDMYNRAFDHVHDTNDGANTSFVYYVRQLAYALFPWSGLAPLGFTLFAREKGGERDAAVLLMAWALVSFALFSVMGTKFHHYIFPCVPPLAMLIGVVVDRAWGLARSDAMAGAGAIAAATITALVGWDLASAARAEQPGAIRLLQLFTYQYNRGWPAAVDLHVALAVFAILATALAFALGIRRARRFAVLGFSVVALAWAAWGLDVYMPRLAPHWGQRDMIAAYYREAGFAPSAPLVAYQLNWKGENFYTGNRVAQFVSSGAPFAQWIRTQRDKGTRIMYVVTESGRVGGLRSEITSALGESGSRPTVREITTHADSNQFILVKAEL
jgi:4-amino-4-deoxy-L-arabinose transferase-like glycosyltransferase